MNIVSGSIADLLPSFREFSDARFLLLFVGGSPNDQVRLSRILDAGDTIDMLSGSHVDIFFFYDGQESLLKFRHRPHTIELLPGSRFGSYEESLFSSDGVSVVNVRDADVERFGRDIVSSTISAGRGVADFFGLDPGDFPCLVVSTGFPDESFAIPTFGMEDVEVILQLLKDVAALRIPSLSAEVPKLVDPASRIRKHKDAIPGCQQAIQRRLDSLRSSNDAAVDKILADVSSHIDTLLNGSDPLDPADRAELMVSLSKLVVAHPSVRRLEKSIVGLEVHKQCIRNIALNYESAVAGLTGKLQSIEDSKGTLGSFEVQLFDLAEKYQAKFRWKYRIQTVATWMRSVLGVAKGIKDLTDAEKAVRRLLNGADSNPTEP